MLAAGVIQAPKEIEVTFKGQRFTATIESDGLIHFEGQTYSPSHAGGMVRNKGQRAATGRARVPFDERLDLLALPGSVTRHPQPISKWLERLD